MVLQVGEAAAHHTPDCFEHRQAAGPIAHLIGSANATAAAPFLCLKFFLEPVAIGDVQACVDWNSASNPRAWLVS